MHGIERKPASFPLPIPCSGVHMRRLGISLSIIKTLKKAGVDEAVWNLVSSDFESVPVNWNILFDFGVIKRLTGENDLEKLKDVLERKLSKDDRTGEYRIQVIKKDIQLKFTNKVCGVLLIKPESAIIETISEKDIQLKFTNKVCGVLLIKPESAIIETISEKGKHWTRVSLLLELISSAYPVAVPGFEPRTSDMRGFLIYKRSDKYGAQDLRQIMGLESSTSGGFCDIVNALFMQQTFWYSEHYQGCRPLDDVTEIPSLIASISFDYAGLGAYMSLHESCFRKLSNIMNSIIHTTLNGKLVDEPTFNVRGNGDVCLYSENERHQIGNEDVCLYSENERHQIVYQMNAGPLVELQSGLKILSYPMRHDRMGFAELLIDYFFPRIMRRSLQTNNNIRGTKVQISGQLMDPIRWNFEPELYTPFYDQARIYTAQSLSKSLGNMGLLDYALTMKPEAFRVGDELRGLVGDVRLIFDLFSLGAELKTKEPGIILSTLKSRMQMPKNIDETYTFHIARKNQLHQLHQLHCERGGRCVNADLPHIAHLKVGTTSILRILIVKGSFSMDLYVSRTPFRMDNLYLPLVTGPDMKRNADNLPDLSDVLVKIRSRETSPGASVVQMVNNADAYRSSVALLKKFLEESDIYDCVWYLMPVNFTSASPNWKVSFDLLSLARRFQISEKNRIQSVLTDTLQTLVQMENSEFTVEILDTFEKFTRNMCGVPLVNPECEGAYCELKVEEIQQMASQPNNIDLCHRQAVPDEDDYGFSTPFFEREGRRSMSRANQSNRSSVNTFACLDVKIQMRPTWVRGVVVTSSSHVSDVRGSNPGTAIGNALLMSSNKSKTRVQCFPVVWSHKNNYARTGGRLYKREWFHVGFLRSVCRRQLRPNRNFQPAETDFSLGNFINTTIKYATPSTNTTNGIITTITVVVVIVVVGIIDTATPHTTSC
ncbi:hypothetical protein CLF_102856 [Clonorchis sinensis]|uniref:Uncharacterized protein n=1 Tax=Clonorchis sinensis TaxID=79923 RepID=G7YN76_CLOSI|nr:hypothetical protein CLF_102856 [Clonorchis sinensis]